MGTCSRLCAALCPPATRCTSLGLPCSSYIWRPGIAGQQQTGEAPRLKPPWPRLQARQHPQTAAHARRHTDGTLSNTPTWHVARARPVGRCKQISRPSRRTRVRHACQAPPGSCPQSASAQYAAFKACQTPRSPSPTTALYQVTKPRTPCQQGEGWATTGDARCPAGPSRLLLSVPQPSHAALFAAHVTGPALSGHQCRSTASRPTRT